ncbi:MAG: HNH endonuclease [Spirochaetaceae bacterium]|nr:HNH endonuclease [Spirochaetaceae bacterium]
MSRNDKKASEAVRLYNSGLSHAKIAKIMGVTRQSIHSMCCKQLEYKPRKRMPADCQYFNGIKYTKRANGYYLSTKGKRKLMHRDVWEFYNGKIPDNHDVHHVDRDKGNNKIDNLKLLAKDEHARLFATGKNQYTKSIA